jgi:preprotein translocase SecF subunit
MAIWKPITLIPHNTKIPFVSYFYVFFALSTFLNVTTVVLLFTHGLNLGIDFRGGTIIEARTKIDKDTLQTKIAGLGLGDVKLEYVEKPNVVNVRLPKQNSDATVARQAALAKLKTSLAGSYQFEKMESADKELVVELHSSLPVDMAKLRATIDALDLKAVQLEPIEKSGDIRIQLPRQPGDDAAQKAVFAKIAKEVAGTLEILKDSEKVTDKEIFVVVRSTVPIDLAKLRATVGAMNLGETQIQEFGEAAEALIRVAEQPGGDKVQQATAARIKAELADTYDERRTEVVGGTVSGELLWQAIQALVLTCAGIFTYIWFRFEWQFALGAIVALVHDVFLTVGVFSLFQLDFDLTIVAALLTILGYSVNDTVVIYDRIRENLRKYKKMPLRELIDLSVNETLSRTIMTVGTTFLALLAIYFFGGEVIRGFSFAMLFGVVVGTYSSVFIAAPFLIMIGVNRDWSGVEAKGGAEKNAKSQVKA